MTNTQLEKLFAQHGFSLKDRHDFMQIFSLLPDHKKTRVVDNFEEIAMRMNVLKDELQVQQEILFGETLQNIEEKLEKMKKKQVISKAQADISNLKSVL